MVSRVVLVHARNFSPVFIYSFSSTFLHNLSQRVYLSSSSHLPQARLESHLDSLGLVEVLAVLGQLLASNLAHALSNDG